MTDRDGEYEVNERRGGLVLRWSGKRLWGPGSDVGGRRLGADQSAVTGFSLVAIATTSSKKPSESCGPGFASGWY